MRWIVLAIAFFSIASCNNESQLAQPVQCIAQNGLPDAHCTPGNIFPKVAAIQVCTPGYAHAVRDVPQPEKDQVYQEYGILSHPSGAYEIDHLVSLELGGDNDLKNLWPQSYAGPVNAHSKDRLENFLHAQVCLGSLQLSCAQKAISENWIIASNEMNNKQSISCSRRIS